MTPHDEIKSQSVVELIPSNQIEGVAFGTVIVQCVAFDYLTGTRILHFEFPSGDVIVVTDFKSVYFGYRAVEMIPVWSVLLHCHGPG